MQDADENQVAHNQGDRGHGGKKDDAGFGAALVEAVQRHVKVAVTLVAGHPEQKQEAQKQSDRCEDRQCKSGQIQVLPVQVCGMRARVKVSDWIICIDSDQQIIVAAGVRVIGCQCGNAAERDRFHVGIVENGIARQIRVAPVFLDIFRRQGIGVCKLGCFALIRIWLRVLDFKMQVGWIGDETVIHCVITMQCVHDLDRRVLQCAALPAGRTVAVDPLRLLNRPFDVAFAALDAVFRFGKLLAVKVVVELVPHGFQIGNQGGQGEIFGLAWSKGHFEHPAREVDRAVGTEDVLIFHI